MTIKGLIFDLDGTVTLTQQFHAQSFGEVFKRHGLTFTPADDARFSGRGAHCTFPEFFLEHHITLTPEQIEQYCAEKNEVYSRIIKNAHIVAVPGVENFLRHQRNEGTKVAMATGNRLESAEILLGKVGLQEFFKIIVTDKDIKNAKPAPDIFLKAAEKLKLKPEECIVFEDAVNGVLAAKKANMRCIALITTTPKDSLLEAGADLLISSYDDLTDIHLE